MKKLLVKYIFNPAIFFFVLVFGTVLFSWQAEPVDLIQARSIEGAGIYFNSVRLIIDGSFADEASPWNGERCVYWEDETAEFVLDLGKEFVVTGILIQADDNDDYRLAFSVDGIEFADLLTFYAGYSASEKGMDSMSSDPESPFYVNMPGVEPVQARYLRIQAANGDSSYAVSELQVFGSELSEDLALSEENPQFLRPVAIRGEGDFFHPAEIIIDGRIPPEGSDTGSEMSVFWEDTAAFFVIDLGEIVNVSGIIIQVDCDDSYRIEYSSDDQDYFTLTEISRTDGDVITGLDSLSSLPQNAEYVNELEFFPVDARFIKIYALDGDGIFAVSEIQVLGQKK